MEFKSGKSYNNNYSALLLFFCLGQILFNLAGRYSVCQEKSFEPALMKVSIDHLLDNLELGKINYCFRKKSGKSLRFWIKKICTNPVTRRIKTLYILIKMFVIL